MPPEPEDRDRCFWCSTVLDEFGDCPYELCESNLPEPEFTEAEIEDYVDGDWRREP